MQIIDAQVHAYERDTPARPWKGRLSGPDEVTGAQLIAAMDAAGVDAAVLTSPFSLYGFDASYVLEVAARWPHRLAVVAPVDVTRPDIEDFVDDWAANPLTVGLRVMVLNDQALANLVSPAGDRLFRALARRDVPLSVGCWGRLPEMEPVIRKHADVRFLVDHLGLYQPLEPPAPDEPFADLPRLLQLARYPNAFVKVTGVPTLSHQAFPYADTWPAILSTVEAFGVERCMWGTDWTRATSYLSLDEAVSSALRMSGLSAQDMEMLMAGSLRRIHAWSPPAARVA
jgi:predicted TIM-barrel fold metal-dependent hydrolase